MRNMRDIEQFYNTQIEEMPMNVADLVRPRPPPRRARARALASPCRTKIGPQHSTHRQCEAGCGAERQRCVCVCVLGGGGFGRVAGRTGAAAASASSCFSRRRVNNLVVISVVAAQPRRDESPATDHVCGFNPSPRARAGAITAARFAQCAQPDARAVHFSMGAAAARRGSASWRERVRVRAGGDWRGVLFTSARVTRSAHDRRRRRRRRQI